ncbi:type II secretion system F family protein [Sphingomicrobium arenosum]|uniref:type II secretion system F family protein n=1 Tax=Sphingomicrobium arenosum TaxID=2233861 RepID=UPI002240FA58|nr:type II secretion system F family protein [Sphingomicrobium arenosum]
MAEWRARVVTAEGKRDERIVIADARDEAVVRLIAQGDTPLQVRTGPLSLRERLDQPVHLTSAAGVGEIASLLDRFAILLEAGLPLVDAVRLLEEQVVSTRQRAWLREVAVRLEAGQEVHEAFAARAVLPGWVLGLIEASARSGDLVGTLRDAATRLSTIDEARRAIVTAMTYPMVVLVGTILAVAIILTTVVPQFAPLFEGEEARLPQATLWVLALASLVERHGTFLLLAVIALPMALTAFLRRPPWRAALLARSSFPGRQLRDQYLAGRTCSILGGLLSKGVLLPDALRLASAGTSSERWRRDLLAIRERLFEGDMPSRAFARTRVFPVSVVALVEVGERSGRLGPTLERAGQIMSSIASSRINRLISLVNPAMIVLLGVIVATLVSGVMMGIFALGDITA